MFLVYYPNPNPNPRVAFFTPLTSFPDHGLLGKYTPLNEIYPMVYLSH